MNDIHLSDDTTITMQKSLRDWVTAIVAFCTLVAGSMSVYYSLSKRIDQSNANSAQQIARLTEAIDRLVQILPLQRQVFGQELQEAILSKLPGPEVSELAKQVARLSESVQRLETKITVLESRDEKRTQ